MQPHSFPVSCQMGNTFSDEANPPQNPSLQQNPYAQRGFIPSMPNQYQSVQYPGTLWQGGRFANSAKPMPPQAPIMPTQPPQRSLMPQNRQLRQPSNRASSQSNQVIKHAAREKLDFNNVVDKIDQFEHLDQKLENLVKRLRQRRFEAFQKELQAFEIRHDPFHLLGLEPTDDVDAIKRAYRRLSLKHHPDKGGSEETFAALTKAYCYLLRKMDKLRYKPAQPHELKEQMAECMKQQPATLGENRFVDRTKFDLDHFNDVFTENRLEDPNDDGYGKLMTHSSRLQEKDSPDIPKIFDSDFNQKIFNSVFEEHKASDESKQLIIHEEPEALVSGNLGFYELGADRVEDFGQKQNAFNSGTGFSDYKLAHTTKLIDPSQVTRKEYKDIKELEADRKNVRHDMTAQEKRIMQLKQTRNELAEEERILRLEARDAHVSEQHQKLNRIMLK